MTMMQRRANPLPETKTIVTITIVFVSFLILLYAPLRSGFTKVVYSVATPVFNFGGSVVNTGNSFLTNFRNKQSLVYENAMLRAENSRMEAQILDRNLLQERVMKLEESLGRARNDNRVVADVIVPFGQSLYDTFVIDVGSDHGVQAGNLVVYAGAGAIGEIIEVGATTSKVKLFSSPGDESLVLLGTHSVPATSHGKGDGNFEAKIPQGSAVVAGDRVIIAKGSLILGTVQSVEERPGVPFATVFFRSSFNPTEVRTVEVVTGQK